MRTDYDKLYSQYSPEQLDWTKKIGIWKAKQLCDLLEDEPTESILEIGTGRGDVLNACLPFKVKFGADISSEALEQHRREYGNHNHVLLDAEAAILPFKDKQFDFVLLCDILEHVNNPAQLMREAGRVGKNVFLKIPIENAFLTRIMHKVRKVEYGPHHPSGHLYCWNLKSILRIIDEAGLEIRRGKFISTLMETTEKKYFIKTVVLSIIKALDFIIPNHFIGRKLVGGSLFAIAVQKHQTKKPERLSSGSDYSLQKVINQIYSKKTV